jgi:hypothetical protein
MIQACYRLMYRTETCGPAAEARFPCLCHLGSSLSVHICHPRGVLPTYWVCRVFSGISCGARKLARTPRVTKKKKKQTEEQNQDKN